MVPPLTSPSFRGPNNNNNHKEYTPQQINQLYHIHFDRIEELMKSASEDINFNERMKSIFFFKLSNSITSNFNYSNQYNDFNMTATINSGIILSLKLFLDDTRGITNIAKQFRQVSLQILNACKYKSSLSNRTICNTLGVSNRRNMINIDFTEDEDEIWVTRDLHKSEIDRCCYTLYWYSTIWCTNARHHTLSPI